MNTVAHAARRLLPLLLLLAAAAFAPRESVPVAGPQDAAPPVVRKQVEPPSPQTAPPLASAAPSRAPTAPPSVPPTMTVVVPPEAIYVCVTDSEGRRNQTVIEFAPKVHALISYDRATPCDQDTLRKALKDVPADQWLEWFGSAVQRVFQQYGFFDPAGLFIGDASYLFVPDNPAYEGSVVLWFDEHNHPVDYEKLSPEQRKRAHRERCDKWISLLHLRGACFVYAGAVLLPGNAHEVGPFYDELLARFVATVGPGVIKWLVLDRGFLDGERISRCKEQWNIDVLIPLKKNMDLWADAWGLATQGPWQRVPQPTPALTPVPAQRPEHLRRQEAKRQETLTRLESVATRKRAHG